MENTNVLELADKKEIQESYYAPIASKGFMTERVHEEDATAQQGTETSPFGKDYEALKMATSFNKLQEKHVFLDKSADKVFRSKITESLRVSQIARTIAMQLGYSKMEVYAVGASSLLHDLGCPPFGTYGENMLNNLCSDIGGFCVHAQNIRIATSVEVAFPKVLGLNLTHRTLLGATKSFRRFNPNDFKDTKDDKFISKSFLYDEDYLMLDKFVKANNIKLRTIDSQIISLAEEIANSVYNLNDALKEGLFTVDDILTVLYKENKLNPALIKFMEATITSAKNKCSFEMKSSPNLNYPQALRKEIVSQLTRVFIKDIKLVNVSSDAKESTGTSWDKELSLALCKPLSEALKDSITALLNAKDSTTEYNKKGARAIEKMFKVYSTKTNYLPISFRADTITTKYNVSIKGSQLDFQKRLVADYISSMLDTEIFENYAKLYGATSLENL